MDIAAYTVEAEVEATHWWFVGRRRLFAREIRRLRLSADAPILDIGTSTGTNLRLLRELGFRNVSGLDFNEEAIRYCRLKGFGTVQKGNICAMPFENESFDLVLATDIIEHVEDDQGALQEIRRILAPGGQALITVPAFHSLWGMQDELAHHKRRYRMKPLVNLIDKAGLEPQRYFYFNFVLFAPIWLARRALRFLKPDIDSENEINSPLINAILSPIFRFDVWSAPVLDPPFGVSAFVCSKKPYPGLHMAAMSSGPSVATEARG